MAYLVLVLLPLLIWYNALASERSIPATLGFRGSRYQDHVLDRYTSLSAVTHVFCAATGVIANMD